MKYQRTLLVLFLVLFLAMGCLGTSMQHVRMNDQIDVYGVKLFSDVNYREIDGVVATEEPCLKGYARIFDKLDIVVGYGFNHRIRRITTRNVHTSILGIKPGMTYEEGRQKILQAGFHDHAPTFTFRVKGYSLTLLVDGKNTIFGLTLESLD